jgi:hypothetical protein
VFSSLSLRFSLVLVDDAAPQQRRPLSPFSASLTSLLNLKAAMAAAAQSSVDPAVASTTGPNKYTVCVTDTLNSWLAFQVWVFCIVFCFIRRSLAQHL